jgi:hypothetical protein
MRSTRGTNLLHRGGYLRRGRRRRKSASACARLFAVHKDRGGDVAFPATRENATMRAAWRGGAAEKPP